MVIFFRLGSKTLELRISFLENFLKDFISNHLSKSNCKRKALFSLRLNKIIFLIKSIQNISFLENFS